MECLLKVPFVFRPQIIFLYQLQKVISACPPLLECQVTGQKQNLREDIFSPCFYFQKCKLSKGYARGGERTESLGGGLEGGPQLRDRE